MKILITGGAGFIGSHLADAYIAVGHEVAVLDNFSGKKESNLPEGIKVYRGSVLDEAYIAASLADFEPEVISHHAAQVSVAVSAREPKIDADLNVGGMIAIIEAAKVQGGVCKIIFSSSGGTVYGEMLDDPFTEEMPCRPESPYGLSKLTAERYLALLTKGTDVAFTVLRYGNVYGPRQDPHGEAGVAAIFSERMLKNDELTIFGEGVPVRDYIFINDIVRANVAALTRGDGESINVCTGIESSTMDVYLLLKELFNYERDPVHAPWRPGDAKRVALSPAKAKDVLGWEPQTDLRTGLTELVSWYRNGSIR